MDGDERICSIEILKFMGEHGIRYPQSKIDKIIEYMIKMKQDGRILTITDDEGIHTVILFSICKDINSFYTKPTWDYLEHEKDGDTLYIEKAVSKKWTRELRRDVQTTILKHFPHLKACKWHRYGKTADRPVYTRRYHV